MVCPQVQSKWQRMRRIGVPRHGATRLDSTQKLLSSTLPLCSWEIRSPRNVWVWGKGPVIDGLCVLFLSARMEPWSHLPSQWQHAAYANEAQHKGGFSGGCNLFPGAGAPHFRDSGESWWAEHKRLQCSLIYAPFLPNPKSALLKGVYTSLIRI